MYMNWTIYVVLYAMLLMCMYIYYAIVFKSNGVWLEEMSKKLIFLFHIHISGTSLFVLPVLYSLFLSIQHIQKRIYYFCSLSLSLHKSFSIKLVWGAKKNLPNKPDRNKRQPLGLTKYLFMDGHYFFLSKKSPSNIDPCMAMSIFHNNTLVSLFFCQDVPQKNS